MSDVLKLAAVVTPALVGSAFQHPRRWPLAVVLVRAEGVSVTSRGDHAQWLAANGLDGQARECLRRRVRAGHLLVWLDVEAPDVAATGFLVFDLATAVRRSG